MFAATGGASSRQHPPTSPRERPGTVEYMTVGELARRVGVTVRTIQYYDQEGLLSPSAKGTQNKRLYTDDDMQNLFRILLLKHLGLQLKDIKANIDSLHNPASIRHLIQEEIARTRSAMRSSLNRLSVLSALEEASGVAGSTWESLVDLIDANPEDTGYFWRLTCVSDDVNKNDGPEQEERKMVAATWHEVITEAIRQMSEGAAVTDEARANLMERYRKLRGEGARQCEGNFILMQNVPSHGYDRKSFDDLQKSVFRYLEGLSSGK